MIKMRSNIRIWGLTYIPSKQNDTEIKYNRNEIIVTNISGRDFNVSMATR